MSDKNDMIQALNDKLGITYKMLNTYIVDEEDYNVAPKNATDLVHDDEYDIAMINIRILSDTIDNGLLNKAQVQDIICSCGDEMMREDYNNHDHSLIPLFIGYPWFCEALSAYNMQPSLITPMSHEKWMLMNSITSKLHLNDEESNNLNRSLAMWDIDDDDVPADLPYVRYVIDSLSSYHMETEGKVETSILLDNLMKIKEETPKTTAMIAQLLPDMSRLDYFPISLIDTLANEQDKYVHAITDEEIEYTNSIINSEDITHIDTINADGITQIEECASISGCFEELESRRDWRMTIPSWVNVCRIMIRWMHLNYKVAELYEGAYDTFFGSVQPKAIRQSLEEDFPDEFVAEEIIMDMKRETI